MSTRNNKQNPNMYDYGMDYQGTLSDPMDGVIDYQGTVSDPMDGVIAAALRATGQEYAHRTGKDIQTDRINVTGAGAGLRVFTPTNTGALAISLDLEDDDELSNFKMPEREKTDPICEPTPTECKYCLESPCVLNWKDDALDPERSLYDYLMWRGDEMLDGGSLPKEIRYELYRTATKFYHGYLGKGNRKELPACITGEIKDSFPAPGGNYSGFKKGFLN
jgi:hypothetical protein